MRLVITLTHYNTFSHHNDKICLLVKIMISVSLFCFIFLLLQQSQIFSWEWKRIIREIHKIERHDLCEKKTRKFPGAQMQGAISTFLILFIFLTCHVAYNNRFPYISWYLFWTCKVKNEHGLNSFFFEIWIILFST